ncbi:MAG: hypothetical protein JNL57_01655 [Bacteroidetes bacterium]|nr:hypothetical protein [Bacteroidota bacterium]
MCIWLANLILSLLKPEQAIPSICSRFVPPSMRLFFYGLLLLSAMHLRAESYPAKIQRAMKMEDDTRKADSLLSIMQGLNRADSLWSDHALELLNETVRVSEKLQYRKGLMESHFLLGNAYLFRNDLKRSIAGYIRCEKYAEQFQDPYWLSRGLMGMGLIHYQQERWKTAFELFNRSLNLSRNMDDRKRVARQLYLCGLCQGKIDNLAASLSLLDSAERIYAQFNAADELHEVAAGKAYALRKSGRNAEAEQLYRNVLTDYQSGKWNEELGMVVCRTGLGEIAFAQGRINQALEQALAAEKHLAADKYGSWISRELYSLLFRIQQKLGNYQAALAYNLKYQELQNVAHNWEAGVLAIEQQTLHDFEKQRSLREARYENELTSQRRTRSGLGVIAIVLLLSMIAVFVAYRAVSRQRKMSEKLLLNILPEETARELKTHGAAIPKLHKTVAIVFADIKDFTHIAENMAPEKLVKRLDQVFSIFDDIMLVHGLEKIKTIGDAYMAVAGLNKDSGNPCLAAVAASEDMLKAVEELNKAHVSGEAVFQFRIGIHTGPVISGVVGKKKYSYDIWGDTVNVAARMEQNSHPGRINISGDTWLQVKDKYKCSHRGKIPAKNKGEIDMYYVETRIERANPPAGVG